MFNNGIYFEIHDRMKDTISSKTPLIGLGLEQIVNIMHDLNEPAYRADQLFSWLYKNRMDAFAEMRNIPKHLRQVLDERYVVHSLKKLLVTGSASEPTQKFLFQLQSGEKIEAVLMKEVKRTTICVSSQVGCAVDCDFCATAKMGFIKNLSAGEIVDQFLLVEKEAQIKITNVVFMGMGEPMLNYENVIAAANLLNHQEGIKLGAHRITISTVGIVPKIKRFVEEKQRYKLAISLNGSSQETRLKTMPIAKKYSLAELLKAADAYSANSRFPVTFEYVLMSGINDQPEDAKRLVNVLNSIKCKLNIIPYNEIGGKYSRPEQDHINAFMSGLKTARFPVTIRWSKGTDISAGCGQLAVMIS